MATVEIIGGGIAGLTLASAIRRPEWQVTIREQGLPPGGREVDTAFGLWSPAVTALDDIDIGDIVRAQGARVDVATIRSADDRILARIRNQDVVMMGRVSLRRILRDAVPATVQTLEEKVDDTRALSAELVVGADGARSVVRRDHWSARSAARTHGTTVVRGVVDQDLSRGEVAEYWGDGVLFGTTPLPGSRTNWFTAFPEQRFDSVEEALAHVKRMASVFPQHVKTVAAEAMPEQTLVNGIHVSRSLASFVRGRAVLIGDAAHAMTPNLGRGACEAIRDAVALGALLRAHDPDEALRRYRRRRRVIPQIIRATSSAVTRVALAGGPAARARNRLLSVVSRGG